MADSFTTTTELLQLGDGNISDIDVSELLEDAPVIAALAAQQASYETTHEWLKKTVAPVTGFRALNDGRENDNATYAKITRALELYDASFTIDMGLLQTKSGEALRTREAVDHLQAAFADLEKQVLGGTVENSADGFEGFADEATVATVAGGKVINAGGTTPDTASSVWLVRNSISAVSIAYGLDAMISVGPEYPTVMAGATGWYDAMRTPLLFYSAVQVATTQDLVRIGNLTEDADKGLTDDLIAKAISLFPSTRGPSFLAMNRRSLGQLQNSRTATNPTGAPAPFPMSAFNVPIIPTDQISNEETLLV